MFIEFCFVGPSPQFIDCNYLIRQLARLWQNCCTLIHHISYHICSCNSIKWCSTHLAAIKCILNPVTKLAALLNHKFLYGQLITLQLSTYLLPCTVQLYLYEQDQNVQCSAHKQVTLFHLWMPEPTFKLSHTAGHNDPVLDITLHAPPLNLLHGALLFLLTNDAPLCRIAFSRGTQTQ